MTVYNNRISDEITYWRYSRLDSERSVDGSNFDNGRIVFQKSIASNSRINLNKSFVKIIVELSGIPPIAPNIVKVALTENSNIAPAFLACETLFKQVYYRINNEIVSGVNDYYAQIASLKQRLHTSQGRRDTLLKDLNFGKVDFAERQKDIMNTDYGEQQTEAVRITGTDISITAAAGIVTGVLTLFDNELEVGDFLIIANIKYKVTAQTTDTAAVVFPFPSVNIVNATVYQRIRNTNKHRGKKTLELVFRPCLGIFDKDEFIVAHDFELVFFPHANPLYKKFFIESLLADKTPGIDFDLNIVNMTFYACMGYVDKAIEVGEYDCEFIETRAQIQNITSHTSLNRTFVIDKNTRSVTMAIADGNAGNDTRFSRTKFIARDNISLDLQKFRLLWDVYQFPQPEHDQQFTPDEDRTAQAYYENLYYSKQKDYLPDMESLKDFQTLGPYYHYKLPIRKGQSNPKLSIATTFRTEFLSGVSPRIYLFDHFKRKFKLIIKNGRCVQVIKQGIQ